MSTSRVLSRFTAAAAAGLVLAAVVVASPAFAADTVDVSLGSVPSSLTAGARADGFTATLRNNTNAPVSAKLVFAVRLNGLRADQIRVTRGLIALTPQETGGQVAFTDPAGFDFLPKSGTNRGYSIQFLDGAPSGKASLTAAAFVGNTQAGSDTKSITVKGAGAVPSTKPSASSSPTASADPTGGTVAGGPIVPQNTYSLPAKTEGLPADDSTGVPVGLYIMGALLVSVGGAILWLLFRQRPQASPAGFPTDSYDAVPPPSLGYPAGRASAPGNMHPTAPLPLRADTVQSPIVANSAPGGRHSQAIPPPVDPWDSQAGGAHDTTRAFRDPPAKP